MTTHPGSDKIPVEHTKYCRPLSLVSIRTGIHVIQKSRMEETTAKSNIHLTMVNAARQWPKHRSPILIEYGETTLFSLALSKSWLGPNRDIVAFYFYDMWSHLIFFHDFTLMANPMAYPSTRNPPISRTEVKAVTMTVMHTWRLLCKVLQGRSSHTSANQCKS